MSKIPEKYSAEEWEHLRERFFKSILKTTEIAELGRNVGVSWPFKGSGETPEKYIKFNFEELQNVPGLIGKKKRVKDLMDVLREILAFDDPFSNMADTIEDKSKEDSVYERILKKLKISESYPVNLMFFSSETQKLLHDNGVKTLMEAINFGKKSALRAKGSNDLSSLVNGIALVNESILKTHLPFRIGHQGLYLPEAVGLLIRNLDTSLRIELLDQAGMPLTDSEISIKNEISKDSLEPKMKVVLMRFNELCSQFDDQVDELKELFSGSPELVERYFLPINAPEIERIAIALSMIYFGNSKKSQHGIFKKVSNLFKR